MLGKLYFHDHGFYYWVKEVACRYQNSVGSANKVLRLLQDFEQRDGSSAKL